MMGIESFYFNFTNVAHGIDIPKARVRYIEVLTFIGVIALLVMLILELLRRRFSSTVLVEFPVLAGDALCYTLVAYTIGLMQSSTFADELFSVWAVCLVMLLATADCISAFSLRDSSKWKKVSMQLHLQMFWVLWLSVEYTKSLRLRISIVLILLFCLLRTNLRVETLQCVSGSKNLSLRKRTKFVADYMQYEDVFRNGGPVDPVRMTGYNYLVAGESAHIFRSAPPKHHIPVVPLPDHVITLDKISRCQGRLLNSKDGAKLKDICLSYAFAKLLCRSFYDYELAEKDLPKTLDLVLQGLLSHGYPERAFGVIEVELSFVYDFFYTKYPLIFHSDHWPKIQSLLHAIQLLYVAVLVFIICNILDHPINYDALFTLVVVIVILFFECLHACLYLLSDWVKVYLVCKYVSNPTYQTSQFWEKIIRFVCRFKICKLYWQHKLSQYSLLDSFGCKTKRNFISSLVHELNDKMRRGQKQGDSINSSDTVKIAILRSLRISNGRLSNGKASLERNEVAQLSEACSVENHAESILIWHIATTLCMQNTLIQQEKYKVKDDNNGGQGNRLHGCIKRVTLCFFRRNCSRRHINGFIGDDYEVAISLSNYCAYLVAFAPEFLPGHSDETEVIFEEVVEEANASLRGSKSMCEIHQRMMNMERPAGTLQKGALLGKKLIEEMENEEKRWKVLADYWAEMILFIAPSNNAMIHFEKLAGGGEFITHLWALLTHAGITEREPPSPQPTV